MKPAAGDVASIVSRLVGRRPTWIEIDLDALSANLRTLATACGGRPVWAVVKADAYGHGAVHCGRSLVAAGATGLVVALPEEGLALRRAGIDTPILLSGPLPAGGAGPLVEECIIASVSSVADLHDLEAAARALGRPAAYHVELDTGMTRMGLAPSELASFLQAAASAAHCRLEGIASHLASIENAGGPEARGQLERMRATVEQIRTALHTAVPAHLASSPAVCAFPGAFLDAVRPGLLLYGVRPHPRLAASPGLRPVLALRAAVALVRDVAADTPIGYNGTYRTESATRVAVIAAGYADGLQRTVAGRAEALLAGRRRPYRGAVNMDLAQLDLGAGTAARAGQIATIIGADGEVSVTLEELAERTGTSPYQWLTGLGARVPRVYLVGGAIDGVYTPLGGGPVLT